ncbi:MAG: AbrB family transcriptional regulator [Microcystaceae cyanobacterium]
MLRKTITWSLIPNLGDELNFITNFPFYPTLLQLILAILVGSFLSFLQIPVPWFLGAVVVGITYALTQTQSKPLPSLLSTVGQSIIAIATATRFSPQSLSVAHHYLVPLLLCISVTGAMSLLNGFLLGKFAGIDQQTGLLGSIPGAGPSIVAMSEEMGADAITVAILQYIRIFMVALLIPLFMGFLYGSSPLDEATTITTTSQASSLPLSLNLLLLVLCGVIGVWGGKRLKLPSSLFLGPFLVSLGAFWWLPHPIYMPKSLFVVGLLLLGLSIGLKFDRQTVKKLLKAVIIEGILVLGLILVCLGVGYTFHRITGIDPMTAILGSTPGGTSAMMATVIHLGGDAGLVMAMQMTRMLLILLLIPVFASTLRQSSNC